MFPADEAECTPVTQNETRMCGPGDRVDVDAGDVHEVWVWSEGCTFVIGV
jgi:hypothetical protein